MVEKKIHQVNEKKMEKYTNSILKYCKIDSDIDFREVCILLIEKAREKQIKFGAPVNFKNQLKILFHFSY